MITDTPGIIPPTAELLARLKAALDRIMKCRVVPDYGLDWKQRQMDAIHRMIEAGQQNRSALYGAILQYERLATRREQRAKFMERS